MVLPTIEQINLKQPGIFLKYLHVKSLVTYLCKTMFETHIDKQNVSVHVICVKIPQLSLPTEFSKSISLVL